MKHAHRPPPNASNCRGLSRGARVMLPLLAGALLGLGSPAQALELAQVPLFLSPPINPNVLVMLDNSQSMDGTMGGKMLSGASPETRSNVARSVLRDIIESYRHSFNWGLGSFRIRGPLEPINVLAYYLGKAATMVYTNTCTDVVDGVGVSDVVGWHAVVVKGVKTEVNGPLPCVPNPEPAVNGFAFITFDRSGDDADVNDITYSPYAFEQMYGVGSTGSTYAVFGERSTGRGWDVDTNFRLAIGNVTFSTTDSGWLVNATESPQRLWVKRGWGFDNPIWGDGTINEAIVNSQLKSEAEEIHFAKLKALLAPEDPDKGSESIKNAARHTPLAGAVETSRGYFEGDTSPIREICQRSYLILATDGNPTGKKDGSPYNPTEWVNTYDPVTKLWTYGPAIVDVLSEITALRSTRKGGDTFDIQTYVIGMGDTVVNPSSVAALDEMANKGGTASAFLASSADALKRAFEAVASDIQAKMGAGSAVGVSSGSWQTGSTLYQGTFSSSDWSGNVLAFSVGSDGVLASKPTWEAAARLKLQPWDSGRTILTYKPSVSLGGHGIAFRWPADPAAPASAELDPAQVAALNKLGDHVDGAGESRLRYLRGDTSK